VIRDDKLKALPLLEFGIWNLELDPMTSETKEKPWDGKTERRKGRRPRRRLVDLTLARGTNKREGEKDRRKGIDDGATGRQGEKEEEQG